MQRVSIAVYFCRSFDCVFATETLSVDIAVFCLALMGTDYPLFLEEAHRVLKPQGLLWIAEVYRLLACRAACTRHSTTVPRLMQR